MKTIYNKLYSKLGKAIDRCREDGQHKMKERISKSLRSGLPRDLFPNSSRLFFRSYPHRVDTEYDRFTKPLAVLKRRTKR